MSFRHKVRINLEDCEGHKQMILQSESISLPKKLLTLLFGEFTDVLVLTPGDTVRGIEIREMRGDAGDR